MGGFRVHCHLELVSVTVQRVKSLQDYFLLKLIKYSKLHKRGEKGSVRDERNGSSASVLKWQMQMAQMIRREGK